MKTSALWESKEGALSGSCLQLKQVCDCASTCSGEDHTSRSTAIVPAVVFQLHTQSEGFATALALASAKTSSALRLSLVASYQCAQEPYPRHVIKVIRVALRRLGPFATCA